MIEKKRFFVLAGILLVTIFVFTSMMLVNEYTSTRLIQRKQDEVKAYYTALYFDSNGEGSAVAIDNKEGYVSFDLMNFIGEDVTERDIVYEIKAPSKYYTNNNKEIDSDDYGKDLSTYKESDALVYPGSDNTLNVQDVWGQPVVVGRDTYKYTVNVTTNNGELYDEVYPSDPIVGSDANATDYLFKYEKLEGSGSANAVGKTHNVTLKLTRNDSTAIEGTENISIVIQLLRPYKEVFIINMTISERLIVFSNTVTTEFENEIEELNIQTADIFSHLSSKTGDEYNRRTFYLNDGQNKTTKGFSSKPLKVSLTYTNLILNEVLLSKLPASMIQTDLSDLDGNSGTLVLLIPQSSSFKLQFYPTASTYSVSAKVEIIDGTIDASGNYTEGNSYALYNKYFGGYQDNEITYPTSGDKTDILVLNETKEGLVH